MPLGQRPCRDPIDRFLDYVKVTDDCWSWTGYTAGSPPSVYGSFRPGKAGSPKVYAHRFAYEMAVGPIPEGLVIDHVCANRLCVNPDHLEPVTHGENIRRAGHDGLCKAKLHRLDDPANVKWQNGVRACRECIRIRDRKRQSTAERQAYERQRTERRRQLRRGGQ